MQQQRKNKRKSQDPKKLLPFQDDSPLKRQRLGSTGSEARSPQIANSLSPDSGNASHSPSPPQSPKMRSEDKQKSPFRPWDNEESGKMVQLPALPVIPAMMFPGLSSLLSPELCLRLSSLSSQMTVPSPPVQDEPLSLVKHKRDEETPIDPPQTELKGKQRNYKNMTRERRVEANARERQRVHTITAAFDTLQAAIPTEDENQKLSKLSIIKIATSYIMVLSRMAGHDYSIDKSAPSIEECVKKCSKLIESETKFRKTAK